jgi:hypothetical protein
VELAQSVPGDGFSARPVGSTLLVDRPALWATGPAGAGRAFTIHVTNTGEDASTVTPRQYRLDPVPLSDESGAVDSDPLHDPQFVDEIGAPRSYQERRFTVPAGAQHLSAVVTWNAALTGTTLERMTLFDPLGRIVAFTAPQGPSGFGQAVVHDPAPGTWTAVFWTLATTNGYQGPVHFRFTTQRFRPIGTVSPRSQRIPPGQTKAFTIHVRTRAGDLSSRLRLDTGHPDDGSIPITVRGLIPLASGGGSFHGTLTGGNGRGILGGPTLTYQFDVPPARPSLDVAVRLRDTGYDVTGLLVDPTGEPLDVQSTRAIDGGSEPGDAIQLTAAAPRPGRWTLLLVQNPPIDGEHLTEPLTGTIAFAAPAITVEDLPASAAVRLRAGRPYTAIVHVANTGIAPKQVYADPRLEQIGPLQLAGLTPTRIELPRGVFDRLPAFFVPTGSDRLTVTARSTVPLSMDVSAQYSSPDITSLPSGTQATAALSAPEVAPGLWFADPTETGPFGASPAPIVAADLTAAVSSHLFDPAVTSDTGDFQKTSVDPDTPFTPLVLAPRHSGSIRLTITPAAAEGTVVRGYVAIATVDPHTFSGDELIRLPYAYTVT